MAIECDKFELGIGYVVDKDICLRENISDFAECFGASEEVQFFRNTDVDFCHTRIVESQEFNFEIFKVCVPEDQEHTQVFKEGCLGDVHFQFPLSS